MVAIYQPQNLNAEQADGSILLTWNAALGATSYQVQRSTDGVNFSNLAAPVVNSYLDSLPGVGIMYYYQVAAVAVTGAFAVATLTFAGQPNTGAITIANVTLTPNINFSVAATVAGTMQNFVAAVNNQATLKLIVSAAITAPTVITVTALQNGTSGNGLEWANALLNVTDVPFTNGINPVQSAYSSVAQAVAAPPSEMSLYELRLRAQQTADRVNSQFVTTTEWNAFLRLALYELYDILIMSYEDLFASSTVFINTNGVTQNYAVPDGATNYFGSTFPSTGTTSPAPAFYKLAGMDLGVNTSNNAWVTLKKFDFIDRNKYVYPNSTSTIYGVYNMAYRLMGNFINIIPVPAGNQQLRMWYSPKLPQLLQDTDLTTLGYSGWLRYAIVRAAKYALDKEESNTDKLDQELVFLKTRIEQASQNRDAGIPDTISETRRDGIYGGMGFGNGGGSQGGW